MKSMTGFARNDTEKEGYRLSIEIKCYNNRYLDIGVNLPGFLSHIEPRVRLALSSVLRRGKIECTVRYRSVSGQRLFDYDEKTVDALVRSLSSLKRHAGIDEPVTLSHILQYDEQIRADESPDIETLWKEIGGELEKTIADLEVERAREGDTTERALIEHREVLGALLTEIEENAAKLEERITDQIRGRFEEVVGDRVDEDRILAEIASLLVKFSIDEEIVRLQGHLEAFDDAIHSVDPVGKKLDFLCQELNREVNTIGSKSPLYEINRRVVEAKDAIENMREQLRNVE